MILETLRYFPCAIKVGCQGWLCQGWLSRLAVNNVVIVHHSLSRCHCASQFITLSLCVTVYHVVIVLHSLSHSVFS